MIDNTQQDLPEDNTTPSNDSDAPETSTLNGPDDAAPDAQPEPTDAAQTASEDPAPTEDAPSGRRKKRTRAEMEAARAAGEVPPKRDRRQAALPDAPAEESPEEPAAAPAPDTHVNVNVNPIDGKLTAEAINAAAANADPATKAMRAIVEHVERQVMADADPTSDGTSIRGKRNRAIFVDEVAFNAAVPGARRSIPVTISDRQLGSNDIDTKSIAKARLKVYGKYAARARAAAKLWPSDPARYFDVVGKIFTDLAHGECRVDALRHDRDAVAELVIGLLPKSTIEVIECSGITTL